jgi:mRNA interferase HigB
MHMPEPKKPLKQEENLLKQETRCSKTSKCLRMLKCYGTITDYQRWFDKLSTFLTNLVFIMRIIAKSTLRDYWEKHVNCRKELENWHSIASKAEWRSPRDIKAIFPKASIVGNNRVVFDIAGGNYRLVVKFAYRLQVGYIRFIGTHQEYDKIDVGVI